MENARYKIVSLSDNTTGIIDKERAVVDPRSVKNALVCKCRSAADAKMIFKALDEYFKGE